MPAGSLPAGDVNVKLRAIAPLDAAVPEERVKESDCPQTGYTARMNINISNTVEKDGLAAGLMEAEVRWNIWISLSSTLVPLGPLGQD